MSEQITSKDIFDDAFAKQKKLVRPKQNIQDTEELRSYQQTKRKEYEQQLNKNRLNYGQWIRYARWEIEHNHDFARARSIFERALDVDIQHIPFWIQYIQLELGNKNINHARNLLHRATNTLPKVNKLWFLYIQTEEMLKNYQMVRNLFEDWLQWHPDEIAWDAYVNFETRYEENENIRSIYKRYVEEFEKLEVWEKWIEYELETNENDVEFVRSIFETCVNQTLTKGLKETDEQFSNIIYKWANWEIKQQEFERGKYIYDLLLKGQFNLPSKIQKMIYETYIDFEKKFGSKETIESSVIAKRRLKYEHDVERDAYDYDSWWLLITILMENYKTEDIRGAFQKVTSQAPQDEVKSIRWRRYVMLWIRYAFWEEFDNQDIERSREVWNKCLKIIPHKRFSFSKIWKGYADFEMRNSNSDELVKVRKIYGRSIGQTSSKKPKPSIFKNYIDFEKRLGEWDRIRSIYEKWLEIALINQTAADDIISNYLNFEISIGEYSRCEAILDLAFEFVSNEDMTNCFDQKRLFDMAVEFFRDEMKYDRIRDLYEQLVEQDPSTSNWISFALFESTIPSTQQLEDYLASNQDEFEMNIENEQIENSRDIFNRAERFFKNEHDDEGRLTILKTWKSYEEVNGTELSLSKVVKKFPTIVKKHKKNLQGIEEEYLEYIFPGDEQSNPTPGIGKFLLNAKKWAESQT